MLSRFLQLFLLCSLILLVPSLLYLSNSSSAPILDSGHLYAPGSLLSNDKQAGDESPQLNQGNGFQSDPNLNPNSNVPQSWKFPDSFMNPLHKAEDYWNNFKSGAIDLSKEELSKEKQQAADQFVQAVKGGSSTILTGGTEGAIMGKMKNETAKAELGRATWKFLHTMTLRYPEHPTPSERETLSTFFHTFSLLYPCGECASHFQALLKEMPPQTSSRKVASLWLCAAHNKVNERLKKPKFPCDKLDANYDCGCGDESVSGSTTTMGPVNIPIPSVIQTFAGTEAEVETSSSSTAGTTQSMEALNANNWVPPPLPIKRDSESFLIHVSGLQKRGSRQCQAAGR